MCRDIKTRIEKAVVKALGEAFGDVGKGAKPMVTNATRAEFGDYQCNAAMGLAKKLKQKPRDVAGKMLDALDLSSFCETPSIAGPGFLNIKLKNSFIEDRLLQMAKDPDRLGVPKKEAKRIVIDFSSPNIAKEMHVGHLRSTMIGESLARTLEFIGYDLLRLNHVGDWGTQFGRLILYLKEVAPEALTEGGQRDLGDLVEFYKKASKRCETDEEFNENARKEVVKLQGGDEESLKAWNLLCDQSRIEFQKIYDMLSVTLIERGESYYNAKLPGVIEELRDKNLIAVDDGATVVYLEKFKNRDGNPQPLLVQKRDGGYMYATTDLAAIQNRTLDEKAERVLYVVDAGQGVHFEQVFQVARRGEMYPYETASLEHVPFGLVLGEDGKKLRTRAGDTIKLKDLLTDSIAAAESKFRDRLSEEKREETEEYIKHVGEVIGLSAVKYADLRTNRTSDYRFSFERMLALDGNTAPYMLYAYSRIQAIFRKLGIEGEPPVSPLKLEEPQEAALGRMLIRLPEVIADVDHMLMPHILCDYLFELSQRFNQFYETCSIVGAGSEDIRSSRITLADLTAKDIRICLHMLGIPTLDRI
ncbi:hypothetical protein NDN08_007983 [Rhodosorus marinus]|uniref:arginine--tRNA ligase n=1 Tax=Rhodosorus marinus TaxID=101924 RepID=A0AAV8UZ57_9RHOD|nr:hypothetical protein NDN08_007983 [Rhodosorus marinus]